MRPNQLFVLAGIAAICVSMSGCGRGGGGAGMSPGGGAQGGGSSALIGQWTLSQQIVDPQHEGFVCTRTALTFAPNSWSYVQDGKVNQFPVSGYDMTSGKSVIVHTLPSEESFTVIENNTISGIELTTKCVYTRAG